MFASLEKWLTRLTQWLKPSWVLCHSNSGSRSAGFTLAQFAFESHGRSSKEVEYQSDTWMAGGLTPAGGVSGFLIMYTTAFVK